MTRLIETTDTRLIQTTDTRLIETTDTRLIQTTRSCCSSFSFSFFLFSLFPLDHASDWAYTPAQAHTAPRFPPCFLFSPLALFSLFPSGLVFSFLLWPCRSRVRSRPQTRASWCCFSASSPSSSGVIQNVFSCYGMCSLAIECVLLLCVITLFLRCEKNKKK